MSRRKQARPQHYATSDDELDHEPELDDTDQAKLTTTTESTKDKLTDNQDGTNSKTETKLHLDSDTSAPSTEEDNDENLNSGNRSIDFKRRLPEESDTLETTKLKTLSNGLSIESNRTKNQENKLEHEPKQVVEKENGLPVEPVVHSKAKDNCNYTSPLKSNYNVNLSIVTTMKSNSTAMSGPTSHPSSTKNLCDKCGGTYATLAALISHKKSCKGSLNRKRATMDRHKQIEHKSAKSRKPVQPENEHIGEENGQDEQTDTQHPIGAHSADHTFKFMNDVAAAAMNNSAGPFANSAAQWPMDLFPSGPFPGPTPEIGALLESLTPIFAQVNADRADNSSPTPEEQQQQQAALQLTQQMMWFHMLNQLHGGSPIPPLPLLAAAAAAAAAHQPSQMSSSPAPVSAAVEPCTENGTEAESNSAREKNDSLGERLISRYSQPLTSSLSYGNNSLGDHSSLDNPADDKEDEPKRPLSASSSCTNVSTSQAPSTTRKLLSSLMDLKDTNPDAPLPPMMSPPKADSSDSAAPFNEPNTLELLQKHTEQALQNTMSGGSFLLNGSSDSGDLLSFRKGKDGKEDPSSRHRCRYCGKVFGSDSALQIHIRSHTGERPFKCNVCGNRFTTKGNLKVHFQRHKAKYPHVKMNPHPVPEHLDKFHPPLEPPSNSQSPPPAPPGFFPSSSTTFSNNFHIPAIFSSTLIPFGSEDGSKSEANKSSDDKSKSKTRSLFDFSELYLNKADSSRIKSLALTTRSDHSSDHSQSEGEENESTEKQIPDETDTSDIDEFESNDGAINLRKKDIDEDVAKDLKRDNDKSESLVRSIEIEKEANRMDDDSCSRVEIDSNDELSDDDFSQYGMDMEEKDACHLGDSDDSSESSPFHVHSSYFHSLPGKLPSSLGLMGLPFGVDLSSIPNSSAHNTGSLPGQPFLNARSESDSDLGEGASKDPIFYQSLLPKPGSTDSTWETLMEVQKASETAKLQQLVDNIEHKLKDPNQCFFCKRVLSCKSALQMHYRTHTGERPFKCKICSRAFTTKGNLKTHMGVHRVKPPLRMMHQCPICHKQFTNALVLQQHIRTHTGEHGNGSSDIGSDLLAELKNNPLLPSNFPRAFLPPTFGPPFSIPPSLGPIFPPSLLPEIAAQHFASASFNSFAGSFQKDSIEPERETNKLCLEQASDLTTNKDRKRAMSEKDDANDSLSDPTDSDDEDDEDEQSEPVKLDIDEMKEMIDDADKPEQLQRSDRSDRSEKSEITSDSVRDNVPILNNRVEQIDQLISLNSERNKANQEEPISTLSALENHVIKSISQVSPQSKGLFPSNSSDKSNALDLTPKHSQDSNSSLSPSESRGFPPSPYAGLQFNPTGRPNTTCRICCKTFACYSALEIHIRSHTKERPFKCEVCDRGFSTKGNMKQHMLTHKIRDLPPDLYTTVSPAANTTLGNFLTSSNISKILRKQSTNNSSNNSNSSSRVSSPHTPNGNNSNSLDSDKVRNSESPAGDQSSSSSRASGSNKHMCKICIKPFSSGSALQIHMRTHTGDKPFKCSICGRAFTTKGNLKVHMGTHMWNSNPSRRGRRMSIDLPNLHISPPNVSSGHPPIQSDHGPGKANPNTDLFFPYMPPHLPNFLNGPEANQLAMQQMMLMKMMTANQNSQLTPHSIMSDKRTCSSNDDEDETDMSALDEADSDIRPKEVLCQPEIDLSPREQKASEKFFAPNSNAQDEIADDENHSSRSAQSNHESDWSSKEWKMSCTICSHTSISPAEFDQHIKAHLHAAVSASTPTDDLSKGNPLNTANAAAVLL